MSKRTYVDLTLTIVPADKSAEAMDALRIWARLDGYPPQPTDGTDRGPTTDADILEWIADMPGTLPGSHGAECAQRLLPSVGQRDCPLPLPQGGGCHRVRMSAAAITCRMTYPPIRAAGSVTSTATNSRRPTSTWNPRAWSFPPCCTSTCSATHLTRRAATAAAVVRFLFGRFGGSPFLSPADPRLRVLLPGRRRRGISLLPDR